MSFFDKLVGGAVTGVTMLAELALIAKKCPHASVIQWRAGADPVHDSADDRSLGVLRWCVQCGAISHNHRAFRRPAWTAVFPDGE